MRTALFMVLAISCLTRGAFSQTAFEVATIKPYDMKNGAMEAGVKVYPGGRIVVHAEPLKALILIAFDVGYWQISGGEDWMEKDVYDVEAKAPQQSGTYSLRHTRFGIEDERLRQMLQTLLTDRFQLKLHRETKTGSIYLLEKGSKTFLLRPTKFTEDQPALGDPGFSGEVEHAGGHWFLFNASAPQLAKIEQDNSDFEGSLTTFIQDVGLKLTPSKGPVETLVIEHAQKPSAN
jgi:hypothetical protein